MSGAALGWAWKQPVPMAAAKFVLVALADQATTDLAFFAVSSIARNTGLDRKTVMTSIARLIEWGLLVDTGERRGRTGSIPVYRLLMNEGLFDNAPYPSGAKSGTGTKTGTASEAVPKTDSSGTTFSGKRYQKRDTDPRALIQELDPLSSRAPAHETANVETPAPNEPHAGHTVYPGFEADHDSATQPDAPTPGAAACRAMREAGMPLSHLNPSNALLLETLAAGVTPSELADGTREVVARGGAPPNMAYVCRTALGRRRDAALIRNENNGRPTDQNRSQPSRAAGAKPSALQRVVAGIMARSDEFATAATDAPEPVG